MTALAPTYARYAVEFVSGSGCVLVDADGRRVPRLPERDRGQQPRPLPPGGGRAPCRSRSARLIHVSNLFYNEPNVALAARLAARSFGEVVFFCNSGAEANEAAIKLVRKFAPARRRRSSRTNAFHGRTYGALSRDAAGGQAGAVRAAGARASARSPTAEAIPAAVDENTAAVLIEPIQGESGVNIIDRELLASIRAACDAAGAALVFDEVQTGMGRTGSLWAYEQLGVVPDAMTLAKGLGGGLPIGALVIGAAAGRRVRARRPRLDVRGRARRASAAAHAVLDVIDDEAFLRGVREQGERLLEGLRELPGVRLRARARADGRGRDRRRRARSVAQARAAGAAPDHQRHGPDDAALPAAADRLRRGGRRRARRVCAQLLS